MSQRIAWIFVAVALLGSRVWGDGNDFPSGAEVQATAERYFASAGIGPADLISQGEVKELLEAIEELGWEVEDQDKILAQTLTDSHPLVKTLSTRHGQKFMKKVSGYQLIYDRLDRVTGVSGGQRMLRDLVKLPDGYRYAKMKTTGAVPDLLALLPKKGNGRKRQIRDYDQPTGKLYTPTDVLKRLRESYARVES